MVINEEILINRCQGGNLKYFFAAKDAINILKPEIKKIFDCNIK